MNETYKLLSLVHYDGHTEYDYETFTSFPFVSPFSIHSTVTLSLSSFSDVTMAWWILPGIYNKTTVYCRNLQLYDSTTNT